jgi:hypothetical protein
LFFTVPSQWLTECKDTTFFCNMQGGREVFEGYKAQSVHDGWKHPYTVNGSLVV